MTVPERLPRGSMWAEWAREDPRQAHTVLRKGNSATSQVFGGKGFLYPSPTQVRRVRMLPTRKMDMFTIVYSEKHLQLKEMSIG